MPTLKLIGLSVAAGLVVAVLLSYLMPSIPAGIAAGVGAGGPAAVWARKFFGA